MSDNSTVRVFVGCAANHEDLESQAVLEWSLRKHSSLPVEIRWMSLSNNPTDVFYGWNTKLWATPFSGFRWAVPSLCEFKGKAIYMDSDFMILADIAHLWNQKHQPGKVVLAKGGVNWRLCCSLWDCAAAEKYLPPLKDIKLQPDSHARINSRFGKNSPLVQAFEGEWNSLDARDGKPLDQIKALHYTDMRTQPQLKHAIPRLQAEGQRHWYDGRTGPHPRQDIQDLFDVLLEEAKEHGYTPELYAQRPKLGHPYNKRSFAGRRG